jgi:23S rRNA pseudouridine1911/1915/1917 synthase
MEFISDTTNRLDKFLASKVNVSRTRVQKAIKDGKVTVDGIIILDPDFDVTLGNKIVLPEFEGDELKPSDINLNVVYENDDLAVIDKPAGMVVHPGAGNKEDTLANALLTRFPGVDKVGEPHRPGIVHRLDEYTSGLIIIAKTMRGFDYLKELFVNRKIEKEYLALVQGIPVKKHDVINAALEKVPLKQKMKVGSGKEAITEYWVLADAGQFALLRVKLHTGRTHQIRAHLSYIGHPIIGDGTYGKKNDLIDRQFLHAHRLKFQLLDGTWIELTSELPQDLRAVLDKLKINY